MISLRLAPGNPWFERLLPAPHEGGEVETVDRAT